MQSSRSATPTCLPKPCLKRLGLTCPSKPKHAHFPPPSEEAKRYSALDYDRSPIVVLVNECALPARGERTLDDLDMPKARRQQHHRSTKCSSDDERHRRLTALAMATGGSIQPALFAKSGANGTLASVSMSSLAQAHADSSDSDDGVALPIDGRGFQVYRHELAPDSSDDNLVVAAASRASSSQSRRLRKSPQSRSHGRSASLDHADETFSSWTGNNSCLGGF